VVGSSAEASHSAATAPAPTPHRAVQLMSHSLRPTVRVRGQQRSAGELYHHITRCRVSKVQGLETPLLPTRTLGAARPWHLGSTRSYAPQLPPQQAAKAAPQPAKHSCHDALQRAARLGGLNNTRAAEGSPARGRAQQPLPEASSTGCGKRCRHDVRERARAIQGKHSARRRYCSAHCSTCIVLSSPGGARRFAATQAPHHAVAMVRPCARIMCVAARRAELLASIRRQIKRARSTQACAERLKAKHGCSLSARRLLVHFKHTA